MALWVFSPNLKETHAANVIENERKRTWSLSASDKRIFFSRQRWLIEVVCRMASYLLLEASCCAFLLVLFFSARTENSTRLTCDCLARCGVNVSQFYILTVKNSSKLSNTRLDFHLISVDTETIICKLKFDTLVKKLNYQRAEHVGSQRAFACRWRIRPSQLNTRAEQQQRESAKEFNFHQ